MSISCIHSIYYKCGSGLFVKEKCSSWLRYNSINGLTNLQSFIKQYIGVLHTPMMYIGILTGSFYSKVEKWQSVIGALCFLQVLFHKHIISINVLSLKHTPFAHSSQIFTKQQNIALTNVHMPKTFTNYKTANFW